MDNSLNIEFICGVEGLVQDPSSHLRKMTHCFLLNHTFSNKFVFFSFLKEIISYTDHEQITVQSCSYNIKIDGNNLTLYVKYKVVTEIYLYSISDEHDWDFIQIDARGQSIRVFQFDDNTGRVFNCQLFN